MLEVENDRVERYQRGDQLNLRDERSRVSRIIQINEGSIFQSEEDIRRNFESGKDEVSRERQAAPGKNNDSGERENRTAAAISALENAIRAWSGSLEEAAKQQKPQKPLVKLRAGEDLEIGF
jgi:hypothetical protein